MCKCKGVQYTGANRQKLIVKAAICMHTVRVALTCTCTSFQKTKTEVKVRFYGVSKGNLHCEYTLLMHCTGCTCTCSTVHCTLKMCVVH